MSLHYLLDGYNISNQLPNRVSDNPDDQRENLITFIERNRPQGSIRNKITIVFDGMSSIENRYLTRSINIIFSGDDIADNKIRSIVEKTKSKGTLVVVTDDRELQYAVKIRGAKVLSVKDFISARKKKGFARTKIHNQEERKNIPKIIESKITSEMKKIWLNEE